MSKTARKRLPPDVRVLIKASGKPASELAAEYGVSVTTARRWKSRDDAADRSSRPKNVRKALTQPQELEIVRLWHATKLSVRKFLAEVRKEIAPTCSHGALQRCLEKHGLIGHGLRQGKRTNVPVRPGSRLLMNNGRAHPVPQGDVRFRAEGPSSYIPFPPSSSYPSPSPSPKISLTRPLTSPSARLGQAGSSSTSSIGPSGHIAAFGPDDLTHSANWPSNILKISDPSRKLAFPPCFLEKSIDFVVFNNIAPEHLDDIFSFLSAIGLKVVSDTQNRLRKRWKFERVRRYRKDRKVAVRVYYRSTSEFDRTIWLQVMQPTRAFLETLATFFEAKGLAPRIRKLELSFDFYTEQPGEMFEWLISSVFLKHQRSKALVYKKTFYTNDLRGSANGMRCYPKKRNGKTFTRLEYHASKGLVRKEGIRWLLNELESWDLQNCFAFMTMDEARAIDTVTSQFPVVGDPNGTLREWLRAGMGRRIAESWVRMENPKRVGLMKRVEQLKDRETGLRKPERYFRVSPFNDLFCAAVSKLRFLP